MNQQIKIVITRRKADYHAQIENRPEIWGCGQSPNAALGDLFRSHSELFAVDIKANDEKERRNV